MFVNCSLKQFVICLDVVVILLLNVMDVFMVGGGALLDISCMVFQRGVYDPSVHQSVPSICFVYVFVCGSYLLI